MGLAERWRSLVDEAQRYVDRYTHTRDRRRARNRAKARARLSNILVVCYGNICRSPYAEEALRQRLTAHGRSDVLVQSSGFYGPDRPANAQGSRIARERGIDLGQHHSRLLTREMGTVADLILVMTRQQKRRLAVYGIPPARVELLGDFDVEDPPEREISDPYGKPDADFRMVFDQIDRSIEGLCSLLGQSGQSS